MTRSTTILLILTACGGNGLTPEQRTDRAIARIQVHEANLSRARAPGATGIPACAERCKAADEVCVESGHICRIARDLEDADALTRCDRATAVCRSDRAHAQTDCACGGDG